MTSNKLKEFIKQVFVETIENMNATQETYAKYFSPDYIQYVDGKTLDYSQFIAHMKAQKDLMQSLKITFKQIIVEDNKVATVHIASGFKKDGGEIVAQVNAVFEIKDNQIIFCDELTHLLKGGESDKDIGSRC